MGAKYIRTLAYQPVLNAELAIAARDLDTTRDALVAVASLHRFLSKDKEIRDGTTKLLWRWLNEAGDHELQRRLFDKEMPLSEKEGLIPFCEAVFRGYIVLIYDTFASGLNEGDDANFRDTISAYGRLLNDFINGGFGADRDIEHDAWNAEQYFEIYREREEGIDPQKQTELEEVIALNRVRLIVRESKREVTLGLTAILFKKRNDASGEDRGRINHYFELLAKRIPLTFEELLMGFLSNSGFDRDHKWGWDEYTRPQFDTEGPHTYAGVDVNIDLVPGCVIYLLLKEDVDIPEAIPEDINIEKGHEWIARKALEIIEKCQSDTPPQWYVELENERRLRIDNLRPLFEKILEIAKEKRLEEERNTPPLANADEIFRDTIMKAYKGKKRVRDLLVKLGVELVTRVNERYEGRVKRWGVQDWCPKADTFFREDLITHQGERIGTEMARSEDEEIIKNICKQAPISPIKLEQLRQRLSSFQRGKQIAVLVDHMFAYRLSDNKSLTKCFVSQTERGNHGEYKEYPHYSGYFQLGKRMVPLFVFHSRSLENKILVIRTDDTGIITYHAAAPNKQPLNNEETSPLYINLEVMSELPEKVERLSRRQRVLSDIPTREAKKKRLMELAYLEAHSRYEVDIEKRAVRLYKINLDNNAD